jgi:flagellar protein FlbD
MIRLTRLNSQQVTVNSDLIKLVESRPDTVITLINGEKFLVHETVDEVVARIIEFRRSILAGIVNIAGDPAAALSAIASSQKSRSLAVPAEERSGG